MGLNYVKSENILKIYFLTVDNPCTGVFFRNKRGRRRMVGLEKFLTFLLVLYLELFDVLEYLYLTFQ